MFRKKPPPIYSPLINHWINSVYKSGLSLRYSQINLVNEHNSILAKLSKEEQSIEGEIQKAARVYNRVSEIYNNPHGLPNTVLWIQFMHHQNPTDPFYKHFNEYTKKFQSVGGVGSTFEEYTQQLQRSVSSQLVFNFLLEPHVRLYYNQELQSITSKIQCQEPKDLELVRKEFRKTLTTDFLAITKRFHKAYNLLNYGDQYKEWLIRNYKINLINCS